nr:hypothetical protein [Rhizobiaceae bacterium]
AVVPLVSRAGTGIQLKTIEAFQAGYPAVTTSSSLRGIGAVPANVTVADDPAAFAGALTEAIAKSRKNGPQDVDGRAFNESQRAGIDKALARDLAKLAQRPAQRLHVSKTPALAG